MLPQAPLFQFRHGDHICVFYRTEDALMEILTPYICEGLRNGERCFCVQSNEVVRRLDYDLRYLGVNVEREVKRGALQFYTENDVYFATGKFDPEGMIERLMLSVAESVEAGFTGFRSAGELTWAADSQTHCKQVVGYEKMVEECYPGETRDWHVPISNERVRSRTAGHVAGEPPAAHGRAGSGVALREHPDWSWTLRDGDCR
jgi:hypothetical protein